MSIQRWQEITDEDLDAERISKILEDIPDDLWVTAACAERVVNKPDVAQMLVKTGLRRSARLIESTRGSIAAYEHPEDAEEANDDLNAPLVSYFKSHERERKLCVLRRLLLERSDRIQTFLLMSNAWASQETTDEPAEEDEDDPWADSDEEDEEMTDGTKIKNPFTLSEFLIQPLVESAVILASESRFAALNILSNYHFTSLFPYRFTILESIPLYMHPSQYHDLLPANDFDTNKEVERTSTPWRDKPDWVEEDAVMKSLQAAMSSTEASWLEEVEVADDEFPRPTHNELLTSEQLTAWYASRIEVIDSQSGLLDNALALLQHGASQGVPGLDNLGEDLILLDRLIYESPQPPDPSLQRDWTLQKWHTLDPPVVIQSYLTYSTFESIPSDIRRLVLPYLSVLESQAERSKKTDLELPDRLLYQYILRAPMDLVVSIFENSKADMQRSYRIIKSDEDVARVSLAYLYGSTNLTDWGYMSRIFECQPDWGDDRGDDDEAYATLTALSGFVSPSATRERANAEELLVFFKPLPSSALSRLLDVLDSHLEAGEILAKWGVATPLQWFLQSAEDVGQQRARAVRMSRHATLEGLSLEDEEQWRSLLEDMLKLASDTNGVIRSPFGLLSRQEITKIFFSGLLVSGHFDIAKRIKGRGPATKFLTAPGVEEICLEVSREFYDNASSGNMHRAEMKLAYECLAVANPTPKIIQEREFIEATSKICSFHVFSRPGIPISPLEIRLTKNRLDLVARVLSSTDDAYKHSDVILDLTNKLGFREDAAAEVKVLSMLVEVALQYEDFTQAEKTCERMVERARTLRSISSTASVHSPTNPNTHLHPHPSTSNEDAIEVAWHSCYQLGRQSEFPNISSKLRLLGFALELCPTANALDVLNVWKRIELEDIEEKRRKAAARAESRSMKKRLAQRPEQRQSRAVAAAGSLLDGLKGFSQGQEAAAQAAQVFNRVTANLPFSIGRRSSNASENRVTANLPFSIGRRDSNASDRESNRRGSRGSKDFGDLFSRQLSGSPRRAQMAEEVAAGAKQVFSRGIGWLIGGDEEES